MSAFAKILLAFSITLFSFSSHASWGGFLGLNTSEYSGSGNWGRDLGLELGATYLMPLSTSFFLRSGLGIVQKHAEKGDIAVKYMYFEAPITLMYQATAQTAIFTGLNLNVKFNSGPGPYDDNAETFVINLPIGLRFSTGANFLETFLDLGITDMAGTSPNHAAYKLGNSLGARYIFMF